MLFLKSLHSNYKLLTRYQHLLQNGLYLVHPNLRSYVKLGSKVNQYLPTSGLGLKWLTRYIVSFWYFKIITRGKKNGYEFVYISNMPEIDYRDIKFFSLKQLKVLTICQSPRRYQRIIDKKKFLSAYYPIPKWVEVSDYDNLAFEEELIELKDRQTFICEDYLLKLVSFYENYFKKVRNNVTYCKNGLYYQHGDLSIDNVFEDIDGDLRFIDFDHSDFLPPFYDVFYQIVNNYIVNDDKEAIVYLKKESVVRIISSFGGDSIISLFESYVNVFKSRHYKFMKDTDKVRYNKLFGVIHNFLTE